MVTIYGDPTLGADHAGPPYVTNGLTGIGRRMNHDLIGIVVANRPLIILDVHGGLGIGIHDPLHKVIVMRAPVHVTDEQTGQGMSG